MQTTILSLSLALLVPAHASDHSASSSRIRIYVKDSRDLQILQKQGIDIDHYWGKVGDFIEIIIPQHETELVQATGIPYTVTVVDVETEYLLEREKEQRSSSTGVDAVRGFGFGSMGGFYTYAEIGQQLDSMRLLYPQLITVKDSIGATHEGRAIWSVEISDNPGQAEPGEPVVYFDALHHAREPMSMAVLMYYMFWLLENYGTDPEATFLVNTRRMVFVPVVNPDGYVYNQTTNPQGGGNWRKNRRNNGGSFGVDLNRNYGHQWGYDDIGSSPTPSSNTYRGPSPFSEPESRAVRDLVQGINPVIGFSTHSVRGAYLNPFGYKDTTAAYEYYAEFANDYSGENNYLYGTVSQILDYNSNGTTRDFFHYNLGCLTWTPEIGGVSFWPAQSVIIPVCQENLLACKYISWVSGAFADYQSFTQLSGVYPGDTLQFAVTVRNKGITQTARDVQVDVQSLHPNAIPLQASVLFDSIPSRDVRTNSSLPFTFYLDPSLQTLEEVRFVATIRQGGVVTAIDTFSLLVGVDNVLFSSQAESGLAGWIRSGNQSLWDTTFVMAHRGDRSFSDSRYGNVPNNASTYLTMANAVDLNGTLRPRLEFMARWSLEENFDYVRVQLSTNSGGSWSNLSGRHTVTISGQPGYTANKGRWAWEHIDLSAYIGRQILVRFNLVTDSGLRGDGFYFDDLRIVEYRDTLITAIEGARETISTHLLEQNYPNPFNPSTHIRYQIPERALVSLKIFTILGEEIATLVHEEQESGSYTASWDASRNSSGVYIYRLQVGDFLQSGKMMLVR